MKKLVLGAGAIVAVIIVALVAIAGRHQAANNPRSSHVATSSAVSYNVRKTCDILTLPLARGTIGSHTQLSPLNDTSSSDINLSQCAYYGAGTKQTVSLLATQIFATKILDTL